MHYKASIILAAAGVASASTVLPVQRRALTEGWSAAGCYSDYWDRTLGNQVTVNGQMTAEKCVAKCDAGGYTIAGAESGNECWCANSIDENKKVANGDCNTNCLGGGTLKCGGGWRLSVFKKAVTTTPYTPPSGWTAKGCYNDSWTRTIANQVTVNGAFSTTNCINTCAAAGYSIAGTENGNECFCSNTIDEGKKAADGACTAKCGTNEPCGGPWLLSTYQKSGTTTPTDPTNPTNPGTYTPPDGWSLKGCYPDYWTRTLSGPSYSSNTLKIDECISSCNGQGYKFAGMEAGNECYCGNSIGTQNGGVQDASKCSTACTGKVAGQFCGGGWLLSIYEKAGTTTPTDPTNPGTNYPGSQDGWTYEGCFPDDWDRTLKGSTTSSESMTVETCQATCYSQKYKYAGLEAGNECFCSDGPSRSKVADSDCKTACRGNSNTKCGGDWRLSVYSKPPPTSGASSFEKVGCFVDKSSARFLRDYTAPLGNSNSPDACINACAAKGYGYAGVEYGVECYCGDQLWNVQAVDESECNVMDCPGDRSKKCGNGNRVMLYQDTLGWCS